jgi:hypothetical protein
MAVDAIFDQEPPSALGWPTMPGIVAAAVLVIVSLGVALLLRFRSRGPIPVEAARFEDRGARELALRQRAAKEEHERLILVGKIVADGRPRCQASPTCSDVATRHRPLVLRDDGWLDLVRRAFGAPERLRLEAYAPSEIRRLVDAVIATLASAPLQQPVVPEFCEEHVHLAWEEGRAELADIEYGRVKASRDDQARLAYFAKVGLMERVAKRIAEVEIAEKRAKRGGGRSVQPVSNVTPIRAVGEK